MPLSEAKSIYIPAVQWQSGGVDRKEECYSIRFYPILSGQEEESWKSFTEEALPDFLAGQYREKGMEGWQRKMAERLQ